MCMLANTLPYTKVHSHRMLCVALRRSAVWCRAAPRAHRRTHIACFAVCIALHCGEMVCCAAPYGTVSSENEHCEENKSSQSHLGRARRYPSRQRIDSPASCATNCAVPTADEFSYSATGKLHPHCSVTCAIRYIALSENACLNLLNCIFVF